jgi:hypothetical protein
VSLWSVQLEMAGVVAADGVSFLLAEDWVVDDVVRGEADEPIDFTDLLEETKAKRLELALRNGDRIAFSIGSAVLRLGEKKKTLKDWVGPLGAS